LTIANDALFSNYIDTSTRSREKGKSKSLAKSTVRLQTLKVPRASELVAENLRSLIVSGEVAPGAGLPSEKELVSQLGVSRATLREALRILEAEGLIATRPGPKGGIVVQRPGSDHLTRSLSLLLQLDDTPFTAILEARRLLEPLCANLAAERATPEDLAELKASVEGIRNSIGDTPRYVEEQLRFHLAIFAAAHNAVLRLYTISVGDLITLRAAQIGLSEKAQRVGLKAAEGILAAIVARDGALATHRVTAHLRAFDMLLLRQTVGVDFAW
jgi:DNA-binding FadR family transcriptional regulator